MLKSFRRSRKKGFTLVELLVVVAILAILSVALLPSVLGYSDKARDTRAAKDIRNFTTVVEAFAATDGDYPEASLDTDNPRSIASIMQSKGINWTGDETGVVDPWNNPYYYDLTEDYYCIASAGKDGTLNTADDICNIGGKVSKKASGLNGNAIPSATPIVVGDNGNELEHAALPDGYIPISTPEQLASIMGSNPDYPVSGESAKYFLVNNIDLSGYESWEPIGNYQFGPFEGIFDGNNYIISNLTVNTVHDLSRPGLFGWVENGAVIKNVILADVDLDVTSTGGALVGTINNGTISNCSVSGQLSGTSWLGGLTGAANNSEISGCANNATIDGTSETGGIAAHVNNTNITDCTNTGSIHGSWVAGIIADYYGGDISNCHNTGSIVGTGNYTGGVIGYYNGNSISNCSNTGPIQGDWATAGIAGYIASGDISECHNTGSVVGTDDYTGGVIGYYNGNSISNCSNTGPIQGDWATAGVAGYIASGDISECYNEADITATDGYIGGIAGRTSGQVTDSYSIGDVSSPVADNIGGLVGTIKASGTIANCYAEGDVDGGDYVGGLVGQCDSAISDSYATGNVTGAGDYVGGLAGTSSTVTNCYAEGDVAGGDYVGGLAGTAGSTVTNSYALGNVSATGAYVGGLAGVAYGQVSYCYSIGLATTTAEGSLVGGLIGDGGDNVISSYYNSDPVGQINNGIGTPLTAAQMKQQANFDGWDFDNVWSVDNSYPFLINNEQIPHPGI